MVFKKIDAIDPVVDYLATTIKDKLQDGQRVLWLVPGGSAISVASAVANKLKGVDLSNLFISLTDERFGLVDHEDSNWRQLAGTGFVLDSAQLVPVLTGENRGSTTEAFAKNLQDLYAGADYKIGFFGMGPDGHTAGILPESPAVESSSWAAAYDAPGFERITMTPKAILALDEAVVYATGHAKRHALADLQKDLPLMQQPAQALKKVPKLTVFNDQVGDKE
jgi:6-phosphogluconolactonase/glucosamine-6-phosphate isomerase/deaminase